jgi:hypothetical protein
MTSRNEQRRADAAAARTVVHMPVEPPAVSAPTPEARAWEAKALALKAAGYNAGVVARKLIDQHGAPPGIAEALTGRLYGKTVSAFAGDTTWAVVSGVVFCVIGIVGAALLFPALDVHAARPRGLLLAFPLAALGIGTKQIFFALVNHDVPPGEA